MQTMRHAFIAGAESKHPQGYRVGGYVYRTPDDAAEAYLQHANVSGATRSGLVVAEGVTLPVGEKPASETPQEEIERVRESAGRTIGALREALRVISMAARGDEKSECWTIREFLDDRDIFNDDIQGAERLIAEVCKWALAKTTA